MRTIWILIVAALGFAQLHCLLVPEEPIGERKENRPPSVRITAGAPHSEPSGFDYRVKFRWNGADDDGIVFFYEYAIDDTVSENAWRRTVEFDAAINFRAATKDARENFSDWHRFFVRAVDDEGAISNPDDRYFNARTIAPTSRITFPVVNSVPAQLPQTILFRWSGQDLDSSDPSGEPVAYQVKLTELPGSIPDHRVVVDYLERKENALLDTLLVGDRTAWLNVPGDQREIKLAGLVGGTSLVFAVRAVDEAGAIEPELEQHRNYVAFDVSNTSNPIAITVSESTLGSHLFAGVGQEWKVSVPANRPLHFRWEGDASHYGSLPGRSNYAIDIPDVEDDTLRDPRGIGGWIGWGDWNGTQEPIVFDQNEAGIEHNLWIKMRDISDDIRSQNVARVRIYVVPFTFEQFALLIDDAKFSVRNPNDCEHDEYLETVLLRRLFELGQVDRFDFFRPNGDCDERTSPEDLSLERLSRYRHIIWASHPSGTSSTLPLYRTEIEQKRLSSYLGVGGRAFFAGGRISSNLVGTNPAGNFHYPKKRPNGPDDNAAAFTTSSFIWNFLRMRNDIVSVPSNGTPIQKQVSGLIGARSVHVSFPDLRVDREKRDWLEPNSDNTAFIGGINEWEGVLHAQNPNHQIAGLDSLYSAVTLDTTLCCEYASSGIQDAIISQRYESTRADTIAGTQQGRTLIFNFEPWYFEEESMLDAGTAAINWLVTGTDH